MFCLQIRYPQQKAFIFSSVLLGLTKSHRLRSIAAAAPGALVDHQSPNPLKASKLGYFPWERRDGDIQENNAPQSPGVVVFLSCPLCLIPIPFSCVLYNCCIPPFIQALTQTHQKVMKYLSITQAGVECVLSRLSRLGDAEGGRLGGPLLRRKEET